MTRAYLFAGQGSQTEGMGNALVNLGSNAQQLLNEADAVMGFSLSEVMCNGSANDLKATAVTQPAMYVYTVIKALTLPNFAPNMLTGHSLGEFSALAAAGAFSFTDGLNLVKKRAEAMQRACEATPSTMAAVVGLDNDKVTEICNGITNEIVVAANFNCPGQLVISGSLAGVAMASELIKQAGARSVIPLQVGGAFHSPLMQPARDELAQAINDTQILPPGCPVYQNVTALPTQDPDTIRHNLIVHMTSPVRWQQTLENMILDGATEFFEFSPKATLAAMVKRTNAAFTANLI
ncbi:MAG: ACP S-malonyltransferase [Sphingobacteriales bacterium]|mgnify:CR=1 FL=1|jgi:[acyl-carrier-protein] S-malonyltransferase|nr:ACP S-malonyltransferase [Sphingobacteriales bacterium]MBP9142115.1 ACP S-malonyltransferase [Chitinophagales bacterium]MDA0199300.1 ACP S-malonyltransferase [Bacteroidota bacterium]MBK7527828.1 ACP S-malonyltransferase [Sphingobacteriales bacterium]MBK8678815.1 ACP S-malonyltransferase [Sphingobacteriales bacterium]